MLVAVVVVIVERELAVAVLVVPMLLHQEPLEPQIPVAVVVAVLINTPWASALVALVGLVSLFLLSRVELL